MEATKPRLGRGLDALLGSLESSTTGQGTGHRVRLDQIHHNPYQPRKRFDEDELKQLADSITVHGVLQPLVVRATGDQFQLIAGERRLRAAHLAGLEDVPVHVVEFDDQQIYEAALVENIQRSDLNALEKAQGFKDYLDRYGITQEQLGAKLGLDRSTISNLLGLLNLPAEIQEAVRLGQLSLGHAKILKGITDQEKQLMLCRETILKHHSVHALEIIARTMKQESPPIANKKGRTVMQKTPHVQGLENDLRQRLATRVEIKVKAKEKGQIVIGFDSNDDFERIMSALTQ
jgi:ParB family chromosome partitioning protein